MFGLTFLYPAFLIGAASVAVPILLHFLAHESAPVMPFSAVRFLPNAPVFQSRRRLRDLLLLALRVTALVLLVLAFARPFFADAAALESAAVTVVAVDTSFSMSAPGRFANAQRLARDAVTASAPGAAVAVVSFADSADVMTPVTSSSGDALAAIDRLQPGFGGTRYGPALDAAARLIAARSGRIVVVTDLQRHGWEATDRTVIPESMQVEVVDAADPAAVVNNLSVTAVRRQAQGAAAVIRNDGSTPRAGRARLSVEQKPVAEAEFSVAPGVSQDVRFPASLPAEGALSVEIDDDEGFAADNARYLSLDPASPLRVLALTSRGGAGREAFYLERALLADDGSRPFAWSNATVGGLRAVADLEPYSAVFLLSVRGLDRVGRDAIKSYVARGGGLLIAAGPEVEAGALQRSLGEELYFNVTPGEPARLALSPVDARHPIFRPFGPALGNLGRVDFSTTVRLAAAEGQIIARFSDGSAALIEQRVSSGRVLLFTSDLNRAWNDFPLHPTFVPFVHEIARYLGAAREAPQTYLVDEAPSGVPRQPGVYRLAGAGSVRQQGVADRRVAVNVDSRESEQARMTGDEFMASIVRANQPGEAGPRGEQQSDEDRQRLWRYGLMAMLFSLVAEGALARRL